MTHWYTADTHFGHESIIPFAGRPFRHASHMDSVLIERMWEKVGPEDDLWIIGDFAFGPKAKDEDWLNEHASDLIEEITFEREFRQEFRPLSELIEAEDKLTTQIWYGRKWGVIDAVESGREKRVPREVWEAATSEQRRGMIIDEIWDGMIAAMKAAEERYPEELGPWTDFEWGMLSGKLSAIRWMLGDEWDMLDT